MKGVTYRLRQGLPRIRTWAFQRVEQTSSDTHAIRYRFRQGQSLRGIWRFQAAAVPGELYVENVERSYIHRGRRLHHEKGAVDFSFLLRNMLQDQATQDFSFLTRILHQEEAEYIFSFLQRELDRDEKQILFSFLLREAGKTESTEDFSFLIREIAATETTEDFSFLFREIGIAEKTEDFSFLFRRLEQEDDTVNFSFLIRRMLTEKLVERFSFLLRGVLCEKEIPRLAREKTTALQPEGGTSLAKDDRKLFCEMARQSPFNKSAAELDTQAVQYLHRFLMSLQQESSELLEEVRLHLEDEKTVSLTADNEVVSEQDTRMKAASLAEIEREKLDRLSVDKSLEESGDSVAARQTLYVQPDIARQLTRQIQAMAELIELWLNRNAEKELQENDNRHRVNRTARLPIDAETASAQILHKAQKPICLVASVMLQLWLVMFTESSDAGLQKLQILQAENGQESLAKILHEVLYEAVNWCVMKELRWFKASDDTIFLDRNLSRDMYLQRDVFSAERHTEKIVQWLQGEQLVSKMQIKKIGENHKASQLDYTRWIPIRLDEDAVKIRKDTELSTHKSDAVLDVEKQVVKEVVRTVGEENSAINTSEESILKTEHESSTEIVSDMLRESDTIQRETDRSAELFQRFWIISKSGFSDRMVLPDVDYPYKKSPIEFGGEIKRNVNWDSVYPNEFYRRIDRHPVEVGSGIGMLEIDVDIAVLVDLVNIYIMMWAKYVRAFWGWTGAQAVTGMVSGVYEYLMLETSRKAMAARDTYKDYTRAFRFLRWEAEAIILRAKDDMELHGNYYVGLLLEELIAYMENHHFDVMPLFEDVNKMDEWRTLFGRELEQDITWVLDKVKGIRHRVIGKDEKL